MAEKTAQQYNSHSSCSAEKISFAVIFSQKRERERERERERGAKGGVERGRVDGAKGGGEREGAGDSTI